MGFPPFVSATVLDENEEVRASVRVGLFDSTCCSSQVAAAPSRSRRSRLGQPSPKGFATVDLVHHLCERVGVCGLTSRDRPKGGRRRRWNVSGWLLVDDHRGGGARSWMPYSSGAGKRGTGL